MAKPKSITSYAKELKEMIKARTKQECEPWLGPLINKTASNQVIIDKVQREIESTNDLAQLTIGSTGQQKLEVNPLLPHYDKMQRTLLMQLEALGLTYSATPSKIKEDAAKGVDEDDPMANYYKKKTQ